MSSRLRNIKSVIALLIVFACDYPGGFAQEHAQRNYSAARIQADPPVIDGRLDDSAWMAGNWEGDFIQRTPYEGQAGSQQTAYKIVYDNDNIYVAIKAYDSNPDQIEERLSRRDDFQGDWVAIAFDSYFDKLTAFSFGVSAAGVKNDMIVTNDDQMDDTWDPVWYVKTSADEEGWKAEMKIPLTQIRFANEEKHVWGLQVMRWLFRSEEFSIWQFIPQETSSWVSRFGELDGINGIKPKKEVELIPYVMGRIEKFEEEGNPFADGSEFGYSAGLDGKVAVTNDLTLNFTINPDFGQVEADPSEVNLTAYETFFEEKRPFFIEGSNIYNFNVTGGDGPLSLDNLFYSRRIGRRPTHEPETDSMEYIDQNDFTRILGAFKLSGKTQNGWSIGVLESITNKETASIDSMGNIRDETIEPFTNFFNARVQKDFAKGNTVVGGMITSTNRKIEDESVDFLPREAYTGGLDFINFWKNKDYFLGVRTVFSQVSGSNTAITELQESPRRYFQRPDAEHLSLDTNRTSLSGSGGTVEGGKIGGGNWRYAGFFTWRTPGLELNDMGYLREADLVQQALWAQYRVWEPAGIYRSYSIDFNEGSSYDFAGTRLKLEGNVSFHMEFKNYWALGTFIEANTTTINRAELRGGPALAYPGDLNNHFSLRSDARKKLMAEFMMFNNWGGQGSSRFIGTTLQFTYRPVNALSLSLAPGYTTGSREMHYIETIELSDDTRYIIAELASDQLSADFRVDLNITPDLTIQYWGQPFMFSGSFSKYKRVTDPRAEEYTNRFHEFTQDEVFYNSEEDLYEFDENQDSVVDYSIENPNFSFSEFRSNFVLRWEYIPGSTLYVVWSQGRMGDDSYGEFNFKRDIENLYSITPHNVFQIKFSYRISL